MTGITSKKYKLSILKILTVLTLLCLSGCSKVTVSVPGSKAYFTYFDTVSNVYSYNGDSEEVFEENCRQVSDILEKYNTLFDIYHEYSGVNNLCTVNKNAGGEPVKVDREIIEFLKYAREMCNLTDGCMDITLGSVLSLWHDARTADVHYVPSSEELKEAAKHTGFDKLEIDDENLTVRLNDKRSSLDVGALGKGYATEKAAEYLQGKGLKTYALNIGGNLRVLGTKPDGSYWITGIKNPSDPDGSFAAKIKIADTSCVTSGSYERFFTVDGKKYSHIIDPATLYPAEYYDSVSVITENSAFADALSTALFCMPYEKSKALADSLDGVECIWIFKDGTVKSTDKVRYEN